jgi:hypothetical protein
MSTLAVDPLTEFFDAIRSPLTKDRYEKRLDLFLKHIAMEGSTMKERAGNFAVKAKDVEWATRTINDYMRFQKERAQKGEIAESTVPNFFKPIKLFCEMNDIMLNWKKISKRIPRGRSYGNDRAPTREEIRAIVTHPDRRIKPTILLMCSSGIRIGAFDYLSLGDIEAINKDGQLLAAKIRVYAGTDEEYGTFITPEAHRALEEYKQYRVAQGEKMKSDSPVIRDLFKPDRGGHGEPHLPKRLKSSGVKRLIEDALRSTGLRKPLDGKRRHEFQAAHGFRKWFKSTCEKQMKSLHVEMLLGHDTGLSMNYYRPSESEFLEDYLRAVPELTILEDAANLPNAEDIRARLSKLEEQNKNLAEQVKKKDASIRSLLNEVGRLDSKTEHHAILLERLTKEAKEP